MRVNEELGWICDDVMVKRINSQVFSMAIVCGVWIFVGQTKGLNCVS